MTLLIHRDVFSFAHEPSSYRHAHQTLDMKKPADLYQPSTRKYKGMPDIKYVSGMGLQILGSRGRIKPSSNDLTPCSKRPLLADSSHRSFLLRTKTA